jgi:hypothetical protein
MFVSNSVITNVVWGLGSKQTFHFLFCLFSDLGTYLLCNCRCIIFIHSYSCPMLYSMHSENKMVNLLCSGTEEL